MTREEAIKIIDCYDIGFYDLSGEKIPADKLAEAFDMAIEALSDEKLYTHEEAWKMCDLISRVDAIALLTEIVFDEPPYFDSETLCRLYAEEQINTLPSAEIAETEPIAIRSRTLLPTKDFKEWAKRIREVNPNAVVIPCDAEIVSADAVHGEWIEHKGEWVDFDFYPTKYECSQCHYCVDDGYDSIYCPNCGARMKGGAE